MTLFMETLRVIVETSCCCVLFFATWCPRFQKKWMFIFVFLQFMIALKPYIFYTDTVVSIIFVLVQFLLVCIFFKDSFFKKLFFYGVFMVILLFTEIIATAILVYVLGRPAEDVLLGSSGRNQALVVYLICTITIFSFMVLFIKRKQAPLGRRQWFLYALIPASNLLLIIVYIIDSMTRVSLQNLSMLLVMFFVAFTGNIFLLHTLRKIAAKNQLEARSYFMKAQLDAQLAHYLALTQQMQLTQKYRHDILNHVETIAILLMRGNYTEAQQYAQHLKQLYTQITPLTLCEDPIFDAIFYSKYRIAQENSIQFTVNFKLPPHLPMDKVELVGAIAHLINIALYACMQTPTTVASRYIRITTTVLENMFVIRIANSGTSAQVDTPKKQMPQALSFALDLVTQVCKKNNGTLTMEKSPEGFVHILSFARNDCQ